MRDDLAAINHWLSLTRLRAAVAVALFAIALHAVGVGRIALGPVLGVCTGLALFSAWGLYADERVRSQRLFFYGQNLVDLAGITLGIGIATEGLASIVFRPIYALVVVPASLVSVPSGLLVAAGATMGHELLLGLEQGFSLQGLLSLQSLVPIFVFFLVAQQCFFYGAHLEQKNQELAHLADRLDDSRSSLAELVDIARTFNSTIDAPALLARVNRVALARLRGDWGAALRIDLTRRTFRVVAIADASGTSSEPAGDELPLASWAPLASLVHARGAVLDEEEAERTPEALTRGRRLSSVLLAGLFREGDLFAALAVGHGALGVDRQASLERLAELAEHASIALHNAHLLEEARQASALRSEFVSTVSHELRTPLNVIIGYAEILKDAAQDAMSAEHRHLLERMDTCSRELLDLVEATLQVGRLEAGCIDIEVESQSIPALVTALQAGTSGLPRPAAVAFDWDHQSASDGTIVTDRAKVALVVRNLVSNAFKFTRSGRVSVSLRPKRETLEIEVSDTGAGIPEDKLPLIFERFRTLGSAEPRASGVGLGLYIVDQLVKRLGGSVTVESTAGRGTTFRVTLPGYSSAAASRAA